MYQLIDSFVTPFYGLQRRWWCLNTLFLFSETANNTCPKFFKLMRQNGQVGSRAKNKPSLEADEDNDDGDEEENGEAKSLGTLTIDGTDAGQCRFAEWAACVSVDVLCCHVQPSAFQQPCLLSAALQNDATAVLVEFDEAARVGYCQLALRVQRAGGQALLIAAERSVISSSLNTGLEIGFRPENLAVVRIAVIMIDKTKVVDRSHIKFVASLSAYDDPHKAS